jgi:hypothetical protein
MSRAAAVDDSTPIANGSEIAVRIAAAWAYSSASPKSGPGRARVADASLMVVRAQVANRA